MQVYYGKLYHVFLYLFVLFACPVGQVGLEFQLCNRYFQLSRAVAQLARNY